MHVRNTDGEVLAKAEGENAFSNHVLADIDVMATVPDLLIAHRNIASGMIDNINGLIAVRSFLTDLFFVDQVVLEQR